MAVLQTGLAKSLAEDYTIDQSLRFNDDDPDYLTWTPASDGNRETWTFSCWIKRTSSFAAYQRIFGSQAQATHLYFNNGDLLFFDIGDSGSLSYTGRLKTTQVFRDPSAWYHLVAVVDTSSATTTLNGSSTDRMRLYVNGSQVTSFSSTTVPAQDYESCFNEGGEQHSIGYRTSTQGDAGIALDAYLAEVYFIDGQALTPSSFGETDDDTNQWKPIEYAGTYGTNGFYQKYAATELANSFTDSSSTGTLKHLTFDGSNDYVAATTPLQGGTSYAFTISGWVRHSGAGGYLWSQYPNDSTGGRILIGDSGSALYITTGGTEQVRSTSTLTAGNWYHFAFTRLAESWKVYINGSEDDSEASGDNSQLANTAQGLGRREYDPSTTYWLGEVAQFATWNTELSSANVTGLYNSGDKSTDWTTSYSSGMQSYWAMGNKTTQGTDTASTIYDQSGNDNTGTTNGSMSAPTTGHPIFANGDVANARGFGNDSTAIDAFTSTGSGTWTCPVGVTEVEVLIVGGGGGGGSYYHGAGGGAGGVVHDDDYTVVPGTVYDITVGAKGGKGSGNAMGSDGTDSVFNVNAEGSGLALTAKGGGGGANESNSTAATGGSGGGGTYNSAGAASNQGTFTGATSYGNAGGTGTNSTYNTTGAGGGADAAGTGGTDSRSGDGGDGHLFSNFTSYGVSGYFAGGGGGSVSSGSGTGGNGGAGGGGAGSYSNGGNATASTGSGGGGGERGGSTGGDGADGVVLIRYTRVLPGTSSIAFDGTGDYLSLADSTDWEFGTGDFTVEGWWWIDSSKVTSRCWSTGSGNGDGFMGVMNTNNSTVDFLGGDGGSWTFNFATPSSSFTNDAWNHVAWVRDGTTVRTYVGGVQKATDTYIGSGVDDDTDGWWIGRWSYDTSNDMLGYLDEYRVSNTCRYPDGTTFTPQTTQFTADANTMLLIHSDFDGGLGADSSGNKNDFSATNLVATDQMKDSPTNNIATLNPVWISGSNDSSRVFSEGNLKVSTGSSAWQNVVSTQNISSGKWYWECRCVGSSFNWEIGVCRTDWIEVGGNTGPESAGSYCVYCSGSGTGGTFVNASHTVNNDYVWAEDDIMSVAYDAATGYFWLAKNNVWFDSGDPAGGSGYIYTVIAADRADVYPIFAYYTSGAGFGVNFGSDSSFAGNETAQGNQDGNSIGDFYYEPPSGFLALCTDNLPDPEIALPGDHFNTVLYTGNTSTNAITGVGFQPDFVWAKDRAANYHGLWDAVRGVNKVLYSNATTAETESATTGLASFDSDGFTLGANTTWNNSGNNLVAWNWLAGGTPTATNIATTGVMTSGSVFQDGVSNTSFTPADGTYPDKISANTTTGFSIVNGPTSGSATQYAHGLSQAPELIIAKSMDKIDYWPVGATVMQDDWGKFLVFNSDGASGVAATIWNDTAPTADVFTIGNENAFNNAGENTIFYCFHSVEGYSKIGSYTGNNNVDGTFIYTGFKPAFVMVKRISGVNNWVMTDSARSPYNAVDGRLWADLNNAESTSDADSDFVSNGFKLRVANNASNPSDSPMLYIAFAESPFKYSNAR